MMCGQCSPSFKALEKLKAAKFRDRMRASELPQRLNDSEELQSLAKLASEELLLYDKELSRLRFLVRSVQREKQELQREITLLQSLHAPIRLLPPEILGRVFEYYVEAAGGNRFGYRPKAIIPASVLAAVCKRWNEVISHSASLWRWISIRFGSKQLTEPSHLSLVINRSITANGSRIPLRVHLEATERAGRREYDVPMLQAIAKECKRWSTLVSQINGDFATSEPLRQIEGHLDQLWCLDIRQEVVRSQRLSIFANTPQLRILHFDELHDMPRVDIPLLQVKTMSVRLWGQVRLEDQLLPCKDVTKLTVNLSSNFWTEPPQSRFLLQCGDFTLDVSHHISYGVRDSERGFFAGIKCSNLESMTLLEKDDSRATKPFFISEFRSFLVASGQKLRSLHIITFPLKDVNELITALGAMPLLEEFIVTEGCPSCCLNCSGITELSRPSRERCLGRSILDAAFLGALTVTGTDGFTAHAQAVLPNLKTLELTASRMEGDFEFLLLANMLSSRYFVEEGFVKLEKVVLVFPGMVTEASNIDLFRWIHEAGVNLAVYDKERRVL